MRDSKVLFGRDHNLSLETKSMDIDMRNKDDGDDKGIVAPNGNGRDYDRDRPRDGRDREYDRDKRDRDRDRDRRDSGGLVFFFYSAIFD